jgi:hypothetical protein
MNLKDVEGRLVTYIEIISQRLLSGHEKNDDKPQPL